MKHIPNPRSQIRNEIVIPEYPFKGYIFDCDGTLADSMPLHYKAWNHAFTTHQARFDFTWELFYAMAGTGLHRSVELLNQRFDDSLDPHAVVATQSKVFFEAMHTLQPIHSVVDIARSTVSRLAMSVASGGGRQHVHETLHIIGVAHLFEVVVTQEDVLHSKPAPDLFLLAAEKMGVDPQHCLVFEDSLLGIEAAERAGMQAVYIEPQSSLG